MYRVLIADDHPIVRRGLRQILEEAKAGMVIEEAECGSEAVEKATRGRFDVVLMDISMPGMNGIEALDTIKRAVPALPVIMLSIYPEEEYAMRALKSGAAGYLTKKSAPDELVIAIKKVSRGERYISPALADFLASHLTDDNSRLPHESLSNREFDVMMMLTAGKQLKEIAAALNLSPKTVSTYRTRILEKMHMNSNAELVQYVLKNNLSR